MSQSRRDFVHGVYEFDALIRRLSPSDWNRPTPCERWDVTQLVKHVSNALFMTEGAARGMPAAVPAGAKGASNRPAPCGNGFVWASWLLAFDSAPFKAGPESALEGWKNRRDHVLVALDECDVALATMSVWGHLNLDDWLAFACGDPFIHSWDLAKAVDSPVVLGEDVARRVLRVYADFDSMGDRLRMPATLAPVQSTTDASSAVDQLVAFAGRSTRWTAPSD